MKEPASLAARPHAGKLPIPFVTHVDERTGRPDFRHHDDRRRLEVAVNGLCQLCGQPLGVATFIGTEHSYRRLTFGEPPAHEDCLRFALEVCPWLAGAQWSGRWREACRHIEVLPIIRGDECPDLFMVWTSDWTAVPDEERGGRGYKYEARPPILFAERRGRR